MTDQELSRRKILSGIAAAGGSGALVGRSTVSFFSDEETFTNNSIRASEAAGGVVNSELEIGTDNETVTFTPKIPDTERANPAFFCVRTKSCPEATNGDPDRLRVRLVLECDSGDVTLLTASLREVLDVLNRGIVVTCGGDSCLQPGDTAPTLRLEVLEALVEPYDFRFGLESIAEQCRNNNPPSVGSSISIFDLLGTCPTDEKCSTIDQTISWIAFCRRGSDPTPLSEKNIKIEPILTNSDGVPTSVMWQLEEDVDYVIIFGGGCWTLYDYTDVSITTGVATTEGRTDYDKWLSCNNACDNRTSLDEELPDNFSCNESEGSDNGASGSQGSGNGSSCGYNSCPCEVAEQIFKGESFDGTSIKFNEEDGGFSVEP